MTIPILKTKLIPPTSEKNLISRSGLIKQLNAHKSCRLVLISAPAGFGKTCLLAEWVKAVPGLCSWISLDEDDNNVGRFLGYLQASLKKACPDLSVNILTKPHASPTENLAALFIPLINQISECSQEWYLILDDYHQIENPVIHSTVSYLIENCPENLHLLIATRTDPPLRLAQYRAMGELGELRGQQLRFSTAEAGQFIQENFGIFLKQPDLELLNLKTEGWIAGLQLAALSLREHPDKTGFIKAFAGDDRYIADYLLDEALDHQTPRMQQFLLQTSILNQFCASLCDAVTQRDDSQATLEEMERLNLFLAPMDNQRRWYRYHPLFADLLRMRLNARASLDVTGLHRSASKWFENANFTTQAVVHAVQSGDMVLLERILQDRMLDMLEEGQSVGLQNMLLTALERTDTPTPWIEIALAWSAVYAGMLVKAESAVEGIWASLVERDSDKGELSKARGHLSAIRAYIADMRGEKNENLFHAQRALELLPEEDYLTIAFAAMMLATAYHRNGQSQRALEVLMGAINSCRDKPQSHIIIDLHCMLAQTYHMLGRHQDSYDSLGVAHDMARQRSAALNRDLPIIGFIRVLKARILYEWNQLEQAEEELEAGLDMIQSGGENDSYLAGLIMSIRVKIASGKLESARTEIEVGLEASQEIPYWHQVIEVLEALYLAKAGRQSQVEKWFESHKDLFEQEPDYQQYGSIYHLIEVLLELGEYERASDLGRRMLSVIESGDSPDLLVRFLVLHSISLYCLGEEQQALRSLERALLESRHGPYLRTYLDRGDKMGALLYLGLERGVLPEPGKELLMNWPASDRHSPTPLSAASQLVEALTNRELEVLELVAEGKTNKEIAGELVLSLFTIKSHARSIYGKLGVKNRTEAVARARSLGILTEH